jgi:hypothetical protein
LKKPEIYTNYKFENKMENKNKPKKEKRRRSISFENRTMGLARQRSLHAM